MDSITIAQYLSIPTAFLLSGYGISASQGTVPLLYKLPASVSSEVFKGVYKNGATFIAPCAIMSASALAYLAYAIPAQRKYYAGASACILSTQIFTLTVMLPDINRMIAISESAVEQQKADASGEALKLMKSWVVKNYCRVAMHFSGGMLALWSAWNGA
jgi:hypothetical protein